MDLSWSVETVMLRFSETTRWPTRAVATPGGYTDTSSRHWQQAEFIAPPKGQTSTRRQQQFGQRSVKSPVDFLGPDGR